jgi:hypothetical protein
MKYLRLSLGLLFGGLAAANTVSTQVTVPGTAGPWLYSGALNSARQYGVNDQTAPLILDSSSGFWFAPGNILSVQYVSGGVSAGAGHPLAPALGDFTSPPINNSPGSTGKLAPSAYMNPATYPIFLVELVGTFADSSGAIVGTPFAVGLGKLVKIPGGASQLQLGVNDDFYSDNTGSFDVQISGNGVPGPSPEPASFALLVGGLGAVILLRRGSVALPRR